MFFSSKQWKKKQKQNNILPLPQNSSQKNIEKAPEILFRYTGGNHVFNIEKK